MGGVAAGGHQGDPHRGARHAGGRPAKRPGEFVNTWSVEFVGEGCQPAELGWGTHEKALPPDGHRHGFGCDAAIYLMRPGASTRVRTWTPLEGPFHGFLITHNESISIADYYTARNADGSVRYRPTAHYAYHPCDDAVLSVHELAGKNWEMQPEKRLMTDEIVRGMDELGVLLMGHAKGAYWYGSRLTIEEARRVAPHNNATSLQVTAAVLAGVIWAMENPRRAWWNPTRSTTGACWRSASRTSVTWSASIPTGRRCRIAACCSRGLGPVRSMAIRQLPRDLTLPRPPPAA
jgi:homospermidine synthase